MASVGSAPSAALLHSWKQGLLHLPEKVLEALTPRSRCGEVIGKGAGVAEVNQQTDLLRTQAEQVLVAVAGNLHRSGLRFA
jgi:hypothetical protein